MSEAKEIIWHLVNSFLSGVLVIFGSYMSGDVTKKAIIAAVLTGMFVMFSNFKIYWETQKGEYEAKAMHLFKFF